MRQSAVEVLELDGLRIKEDGQKGNKISMIDEDTGLRRHMVTDRSRYRIRRKLISKSRPLRNSVGGAEILYSFLVPLLLIDRSRDHSNSHL